MEAKYRKSMPKIILSLIIGFFTLQACETKPKDDYFFVINDLSEEIEKSKDSSFSILPVFYETHNFIFYNDTTIYYHYYDRFDMCGTGKDHYKPPHLFIAPDSLKRVPIDRLFYFMKETANVKEQHGDFTIVTISNRNDTIRNLLIPFMIDLYNKVPNFGVSVRRCTEEEEVVANAKFTNKTFDPYKQKWKNDFNLPPLKPLSDEQWRKLMNRMN